jgi:hypothetical protein
MITDDIAPSNLFLVPVGGTFGRWDREPGSIGAVVIHNVLASDVTELANLVGIEVLVRLGVPPVPHPCSANRSQRINVEDLASVHPKALKQQPQQSE